MTKLLEVENLSISFGAQPVVHGISFALHKGEMLALVGESGSGKSVSALSILRLLPDYAHVTGMIKFNGAEGTESKDILTLSPQELRKVRGKHIGVIFQEPMTSLNPLHTIGKQLGEIIQIHNPVIKKVALKERILELLELVELSMLKTRLGAYPHELSGGQRQRIMIAMALANNPDILIADEPTTALDVTVQAHILNLIKNLQKKLGMAVLLITHDLTIVHRLADRVAVMHQGRLVEQNSTAGLFADPQAAYTKTLLRSAPSGAPVALPAALKPVLAAEQLKVYFPIKQGMLGRVKDYVKAVDGLDVHLQQGETLGVVGESGSGKTTLGLALLRLIASEGAITLEGKPIQGLGAGELRPLRQQMQFVFQDPFSSLNPRMTIRQIIEEGLRAHGLEAGAEEKIRIALQDVGLQPEMAGRYPHEFSGGQRQRIGIARALVLEPRLIVLDEPTSALDVTTQSVILDILKKLQAERGLSYVFISHDLRVIKSISHRVMVMRHGKLIEQGSRDAIFGQPQHDYTKTLMQAAFEVR